jgi:hypothetical protein
MSRDRTMQRTIIEQPGYKPGARMRVMRVAGRKAYRLYVEVGCQWMDGSLADM